MSQEALEMFSLRELKEIQRVATTTKTKHQFLQLLNKKIAEIEQQTLNDRFLLSTITTFDDEERKILRRNKLHTMSDLIAHKGRNHRKDKRISILGKELLQSRLY